MLLCLLGMLRLNFGCGGIVAFPLLHFKKGVVGPVGGQALDAVSLELAVVDVLDEFGDWHKRAEPR